MSDLAARRQQMLQGAAGAQRLAKIASAQQQQQPEDGSATPAAGGTSTPKVSSMSAPVGTTATAAHSPGQRKSHFSGSPVFSSSPPPGFGATMARSASKVRLRSFCPLAPLLSSFVGGFFFLPFRRAQRHSTHTYRITRNSSRGNVQFIARAFVSLSCVGFFVFFFCAFIQMFGKGWDEIGVAECIAEQWLTAFTCGFDSGHAVSVAVAAAAAHCVAVAQAWHFRWAGGGGGGGVCSGALGCAFLRGGDACHLWVSDGGVVARSGNAGVAAHDPEYVSGFEQQGCEREICSGCSAIVTAVWSSARAVEDRP